jgi:Protein of unknown function (DUF2380)
MHRSRLLRYAVVLLGAFLNVRPAGAENNVSSVQAVGVAVEDFGYLDTSGEPVDQTADHQKRLQAFMSALKRDVEAAPGYRLVPSAQTDASFRIVGGIHKMSTLVQNAKVAVIDFSAKKVVMKKFYTFRGDNDEAWARAEVFVSGDIRAALAAVRPGPIALAVFDFELEDTTTAASVTGSAASDAAHLSEVTNGVRELLGQSGRYHVIDVSGGDAEAVKTHTLRDCGGCEAAIAEKLGADQSLIGAVRRVSRTEYTIGFQVRDARTGAVVSRGDSGLRMGADYSWKRGAERLVSDLLIESRSQP